MLCQPEVAIAFGQEYVAVIEAHVECCLAVDDKSLDLVVRRPFEPIASKARAKVKRIGQEGVACCGDPNENHLGRVRLFERAVAESLERRPDLAASGLAQEMKIVNHEHALPEPVARGGRGEEVADLIVGVVVAAADV